MAARVKRCPVCEVSVKVENLERHVRNQHPHDEVDLENLISREERKAVTRAQAQRPVITRRGGTIVAGFAIVLVVAFVIIAFNPFTTVGLKPGQVAPNFTLDITDGGSGSLSDTRGRPVILEFMDIDCSHCVNEVSVLVELYGEYSGEVAFLSIDVNFIGPSDDATRINAFRAQHDSMSWKYMLDDKGVAATYGVTSTPRTFILDENGVIYKIIYGEAPNGAATFRSYLDALLAG